MKKNRLVLVLLAILLVGFISSDTKASFTVATFADPAKTNRARFDFMRTTTQLHWWLSTLTAVLYRRMVLAQMK
jgi:hypothetical protein